MITPIKPSIVGFKTPSANLHRKSPWIFGMSLFASIVFTTVVIRFNFPESPVIEKAIPIQPVIIHLENIPETRQTVRTPAPAIPFLPGSMPIEVDDELMPEEITIEDTILDVNTAPAAPPATFAPADIGPTAEEEEIYEFYAVEEKPERLSSVFPVYPEIAERANIEGNVTIKFLVNKTGVVDSVEVIKGPKVFHKASVEAAKATKFTPAKHNDRPVSCWVITTYRFQLKQED